MLNYNGLRKRASYDGLVDYLEHHQEIIKYPIRKATIIIDNGFGDIFKETYEEPKKMRQMIIINMINGDPSTQTDFERSNGVQVNIKRFMEEYEAKLALGTWHLEGGGVKKITSWRERQHRTMQIKTMSLEANKRYYKANKNDKWFENEREIGDQALSLMLRLGEVETEHERERE